MSDSLDTMEWNSQMRRGLLELCVLALLEERPDYGYQIVTRLSEVSPLAAGEGTVYPLLRRLRKLGWLDTFWRESDAGPPRQYYELTSAGGRRLEALALEWQALSSSVDALVARESLPAVTAVAGSRPARKSGERQ